MRKYLMARIVQNEWNDEKIANRNPFKIMKISLFRGSQSFFLPLGKAMSLQSY